MKALDTIIADRGGVSAIITDLSVGDCVIVNTIQGVKPMLQGLLDVDHVIELLARQRRVGFRATDLLPYRLVGFNHE